jgi:acetyl esterase/lipase
MKGLLKRSALVLLAASMMGLVVGGVPTSATDLDMALILAYERGRVERDVSYSLSDPSVKLDVYYPVSATGPVPAVVYVHGGGWYSGDKADPAGKDFIMPLVASGYLVAAINYRLAPRYQFPAQLDDVKSAVRFLRSNAARYSIDPARIGAIGDSAGGHLVALLGLTGGQDDAAGESDCVQAVVDLYGPADLTLQFQNQNLLLLDHVFGTDDHESQIVRDASPVTYVSAGAPPFLIIQGNKDDTVLPDQSEELFSRLQSAGVAASLLMVENAGHALVPVGGPISPDRSQIIGRIVDFFNETLQ